MGTLAECTFIQKLKTKAVYSLSWDELKYARTASLTHMVKLSGIMTFRVGKTSCIEINLRVGGSLISTPSKRGPAHDSFVRSVEGYVLLSK
jgi:hypothetical protein